MFDPADGTRSTQVKRMQKGGGHHLIGAAIAMVDRVGFLQMFVRVWTVWLCNKCIPSHLPDTTPTLHK